MQTHEVQVAAATAKRQLFEIAATLEALLELYPDDPGFKACTLSAWESSKQVTANQFGAALQAWQPEGRIH